ncbi:hypothetical protein GcM1_056003, partial [Golovinomyces cichoracearum]
GIDQSNILPTRGRSPTKEPKDSNAIHTTFQSNRGTHFRSQSQKNLHTTTKSLKDNMNLFSLSRPAFQNPSPLLEDTTQPKFNDDIKNFISNAITEAIKNLTQTPPSQPTTQSTTQDNERLRSQTPIHQTSPTT